MTTSLQPADTWRFLGEFFGLIADRKPASRAMKLGSLAAGFGYVALFAGLLLLILAVFVPDLSEPLRFQITSMVCVILVVSLQYKAPILSRKLRFGMVGAWAMSALFADDVGRFSIDASVQSGQAKDTSCMVATNREEPHEVFLDSLAYAIENDLTILKPEQYLDLIFTAVLTYTVYERKGWPEDVTAALGVLGLEGSAYIRFGRDLTRYRVRQEDGDRVMDTAFCGFDLECGTCDDRAASYPLPMSNYTTTLPSIRRDTSIKSSAPPPAEF